MADIEENRCDTAQKRQKSALFMRPGSAPILRIYRIRVLAVPPPQNKLGGTRLKFFNAPKNFHGFRPVYEKTRLKLSHLY